jgi:hypothetical protein
MTQTESQQASVPAPDLDDTELSLSTTFELLKNRRRRETISYLLDHDGQSTLSDLAEHIAALENGIEVVQLSSDQRKRVYIGLYQCHLPKLDKAGVIDFDKNRGTVLLKESVADQLVPYLQPEQSASTAPAGEPPAPHSEELTVTGERAVTAAIAAALGLVVLLAFLPVVGGVAVWTAALGLVLGVGLVTGVGIVRQRVDVSALLDSPDSQPE